MPPLAYASAQEESDALQRGLWVPDSPPRDAADRLELEGGLLEEGEKGQSSSSVATEEGKVSDADSKAIVASG